GSLLGERSGRSERDFADLHPVLDGGEHFGDGVFAAAHEVLHAIEAVVSEAVDIRLDDEVGVALPDAAHFCLRDGETLADDVEEMARALEIDPMRTEIDAEDAVCAHFAQRRGGNSVREHAVDEQAAVDLDRLEHAGIGTTGAYGFDDGAAAEDNRFAGNEVGGDDRERSFELFEGFALHDLAEEIVHAIVGAKTELVERPASEVFEANDAGNLLHLARGDATAVRSAHDGADAGSGDEVDGDSLFAKN